MLPTPSTLIPVYDGPQVEGVGLCLPFLRRRRQWKSSGGGGSLAQKDERDYAQWSRRALALLEVGEVPSWKEAGTDDVRKGLLGKTRAFTLRLRVWTWEAFVRWLQWRRGRAWPSSQADVVDFVMEKMRDRPAAYPPVCSDRLALV